MAQVSNATAARREEEEVAAPAAAEQGAGGDVVLNPGAREFLPWWRLGSPVKKALSVDAPEFVKKKTLSVDAPEFVKEKTLSVDAPEFVKRELSVDAPEFVMTAAAAVDAGGNNNIATSPVSSSIRAARRAAFKHRRMLSQWREAVKRTIFVKYIDHTVTEQILAELFGSYGNVVDCRICGDPSNGLRYGFVELQSEEEAYAALSLDGVIIGINPLSVSPSRTPICPINPKFLPQSEDEWEICSRTVYCTNISKIVKSSNLKAFCEAYFGKVCRLKLLENEKRPTNLAFIEFTEVDGAIAALASTGIFVGGLLIRICPSKTPIRGNYGRSPVVAGSLAETNQAAPPELSQ
ncbi:unnamed protein product [Urochloa decumbens]|uniref:RRM domain-containing protein n=1 Tax=Urochloa decumbens TaxID=240449 RepID=A0ABC9FGU4_9POAL